MDSEFELGKKVYVEAIEFAKTAHEGQFRTFSMAPYFTHPVRVATLVMKFKQSHAIDDLVVAALLHDTVEDTDTTLRSIELRFNPRVAGLVAELTSDKDKQKQMGKSAYLSEKVLEMSSWALVIKLCDRLDNVMDFIYAPDKFVARYSQETENILNSLYLHRDSLSDTHKTIMAKIESALVLGKRSRDDTKENVGGGAEGRA